LQLVTLQNADVNKMVKCGAFRHQCDKIHQSRRNLAHKCRP